MTRVLLVLLLLLSAPAMSQEKPSAELLKTAFALEIPHRVQSFEVTADQFVQNPIQPLYEFRWQASVALAQPLYRRADDGTEQKSSFFREDPNAVTFIQEVAAIGATGMMYGTGRATFTGSEWKASFKVQQSPFQGMSPRGDFKGYTVLLGSPEEQAHLDRLAAARQAKFDREKAARDVDFAAEQRKVEEAKALEARIREVFAPGKEFKGVSAPKKGGGQFGFTVTMKELTTAGVAGVIVWDNKKLGADPMPIEFTRGADGKVVFQYQYHSDGYRCCSTDKAIGGLLEDSFQGYTRYNVIRIDY
jgi:hypothetical protein